MAWIKVIEEQDAKGELAKYYETAREDGRRLSNIGIVSSLNVDAMKAIDAFQHSWRENGALKARHREMIALVTSALNRCHY
jgi:alkylhydroperoxidase family enzyme